MSGSRSQGTRITEIAVFVLLLAASILLLKHTSSLRNSWINRFTHGTMARVWGVSESIRNYFLLSEVNEDLAAENFRLQQSLNASLSPVRADSAGIGDFAQIPARIVKMSRNSQHNFIILDKGYADGVKAGSGIITSKGAIGIVEAVSENLCYGISFMNSGMKVSARIGRRGIVAPMKWDGINSDKAILEHLPLHCDVTPGDSVFTSGISFLFPADIPLGTIRSSRLVKGAEAEAGIELFQDFSRLKYVTIVYNLHGAESSRLEQTLVPDR